MAGRLETLKPLPTTINLGCGKTYMPNFLNIDIDRTVKSDKVMDISAPLFGSGLPINYFKIIAAHDVLEHIPNLVQAMTNCRDLLEEGGMMDIIVPYDLSYGAWQDPTHVRAFNEKSFLYYYDWASYLGWKDFGLKTVNLQFYVLEGTTLTQKANMHPTIPRSIDVLRVYLQKTKLPEAA